MTTLPNRESAKIYQFPTRPRSAPVARHEQARRFEKQATPNFASQGAPKIASAGAWYHEEAIQAAERART